jgi:protein involved in polysaccharide export with SLBB domain
MKPTIPTNWPSVGHVIGKNLIPAVLAAAVIIPALAGPTNEAGPQAQQPSPQFFYVNGEVLCPAPRPWTNGVTLTTAIRLAGGFTQFADRTTIEVRSQTSTQLCNFAVAASKPANDPKLPAGTTVHVPRSLTRTKINQAVREVLPGSNFPLPGWSAHSIRVEGEVYHPGEWHWTNGMRLSAAVKFAGGLTEAADPTRLRVQHLNAGVDIDNYLKATNSPANDRILVRGDRIIVPRREQNN